jgi:PIN domain nuclease of toxin-antitoxin system
MNYLLDTDVLLWIAAGGENLGSRTLARLREPQRTVFVSAASAWEIAITSSLGRVRIPDDYHAMLAAFRFTLLDLNAEHAFEVRRLAHHHRDPFDRMLVAQARCEGLTLVTVDAALQAYKIPFSTRALDARRVVLPARARAATPEHPRVSLSHANPPRPHQRGCRDRART